jgi:signal transduction histidine kinase
LHFVTRRARELAERARDAAEQASAAKTRFLAMVSHELRSPLSPVLMAVAFAESDPIVAERVSGELETIRRNVALQVRLIDDLLDVAKAANGKLPVALATLNIHEPLAAVVAGCREEMRAKRLELREDLGATDTSVLGDSDRLQQVFWNLLRNAIKFTPEGGWIAVRSHNESAGWVVVEVADSGKGIDSSKLATIFLAFEQGGDDVTRRYGGLGLGLSICTAITAAHGGTVTAASEGPDTGATFTLRFPVRRVAGNYM